ncbi:MAG: protein translocase SEC61 complex subunit gamma [Nanoarchaeota archaeon]|nr:protein translocase SEC61 complex subunit gamma [Nanoarchaeota archaeon]
MKIISKLREYIRVVQIARKPNKEEYFMATKVSAIGIAIIGVIGFAIFLVYILTGI